MSEVSAVFSCETSARITTACGAEDVISLFSAIGATARCCVLAAVGQDVKDLFYLIHSVNHYIIITIFLHRKMLIHTYNLLLRFHLPVLWYSAGQCGYIHLFMLLTHENVGVSMLYRL